MPTLSLDVYTSPQRDLPAGGSFSPTTATLVLGPTEAILVDTGYTLDDVHEVARRLETSGRSLTTIYITHAHPDHYLGLEWLLTRFPQARAVAVPAVADKIAQELDITRTRWTAMFDGLALDNSYIPEPLEGTVLSVDGHELRILTIGQGDIPHNTVVHIPAIEAVIAGDIVYNGINPFLAASGPNEWQQWIASIDEVAALAPRIVVAGHKRPDLPDDDPAASLDGTRAYIDAFTDAVNDKDTARDVVRHLKSLFPDYGNPSALIGSAAAAFKRRTNTHA
ncbi:MBL fold metallo-hydrolase (plasmid) [Rhodococcus pseudokoreensis]|uniref:MBL fold metallo-hydrolase n=1 Tax=Rhodococcus pseudokoreensis TaxID=2811421 RepID=A0A974VYP3_9NOCA|nr:MBL fold metallo-hydrolase [Rhodococcus pseudokoreensis]QSE88025.1 MBL fold metallo-hydrolase [Rhodococcus pseudokoreensis]